MPRSTIQGTYKICKICQVSQERKNFYPLTNGGHISKCKKCFNQIKRSNYIHKEREQKALSDEVKSTVLRDILAGYDMKKTAHRNNITYYAIRKHNKINPFENQIQALVH
jgi:hypothetical protein